MDIEVGWRFYSADFSVQADRETALGFVTLVRPPADKARWHQMSDGMKDSEDCLPLYVLGRGMTLDDAIASANLAAARQNRAASLR